MTHYKPLLAYFNKAHEEAYKKSIYWISVYDISA